MARQREVELHNHSEEVQKLVAANSKLQLKLKEQKANVVIPSFRPKAHELQEVMVMNFQFNLHLLILICKELL